MKILLIISSVFYLNTTPVPSLIVSENANDNIEAAIEVADKTTFYGRHEGDEVKIETAEDGTTRTTTKVKCDNFFDSEICYTVEASPANPELVTLITPDFAASGNLESLDKNKNIIVLIN